ncbi:MAG: DUF2946 domain-containing protein [Meiothermus sp.]|uniref:DUF2946 family protein n=1 Tax=Meiothermus sp. TaxID=1955249 RepID=UPI0025D8DB69|nr:DUF2946 family protein [Meiothermus sp.]MCS7068750.1 DUF2946 domain-containing protein [Meiothermus sp.]MDW8424476.1 DUF2946 domain-containing protein [Meiothermus sp.]
MVRGAGSGTVSHSLVMGLVGVVLLTSLLFGLRGLVMFPAEPVQVEHHPPAHGDTGKTHHQGHCPLCFLQMLLPHLAPEPAPGFALTFALRLWLGECLARDEFLKGVAARGPPQS